MANKVNRGFVVSNECYSACKFKTSVHSTVMSSVSSSKVGLSSSTASDPPSDSQFSKPI